jgi:hypothetical protein
MLQDTGGVLTNCGAAAGRCTECENPFKAGELGRIDYFSKNGDLSCRCQPHYR